MEQLLILVLSLGALGLVLGVLVVVGRRRQAEQAPFVAELPVPDDVRHALREAKANEPPPMSRRPRRPAPASTPVAAVAAPGDAPRPRAAGAHVPLVDALSGLQLPCDLAFLGSVEPPPGAREVLAFVTTDHTAEEVDDAFRRALGRVGYQVHPGTSALRFAAERSDVSFAAEVHPLASAVLRGTAPAFPTAPAGAVVLELTRS